MAGDTSHERLYQKALKTITELFSDKSVSAAVTKASLNDLSGEIDTMLDSLDTDEDN